MAPMPIRIRKADVKDADGITRVHIDSMRSTYQGIYPEDFLASLSLEETRHRWETEYLSPTSPNVTYVAVDDSEIVGFVIFGPDRDNDPIYTGEVIGIYLLQRVQRKNIGSQLMLAAVEELKGRSLESMIIWVLEENPSRRFYEKLGGMHIQTREITVGGKRFKEHGYGWRNLESLIEKLKMTRENLRS